VSGFEVDLKFLNIFRISNSLFPVDSCYPFFCEGFMLSLLVDCSLISGACYCLMFQKILLTMGNVVATWSNCSLKRKVRARNQDSHVVAASACSLGGQSSVEIVTRGCENCHSGVHR